MEILLIILALLIGAVIAYYLVKSSSVSKKSYEDLNENYTRTQTEFNKTIAGLSAENKVYQEKIEELKTYTEKLNSEIESLILDRTNLIETRAELSAKNENLIHLLEIQKEDLAKMQETAKIQFENLANKILEEKSQKFTEQNHQNLKTILNPLQEKINDFEKKVENTHKESIDHHAALRQQIIGLKDLNAQMSKETINLTKALKGDSKTQGNWGELVLERVLEKSGLEKGREYEIQKSFTTEEGNRVQPDVIINLPDGKKMIVDSKVSLTAYEKYVNEEDENQKPNLLKEHVASLKRHVEQLGSKNYHHLYEMESPDFVLLFIPIEPAFATALNEDTQIYNKAFEKNIVIVTPSTLLATLRTIDSMWTNQKQQENAIEIARQAGALYDKFEGFVTDLLKIGKKMDEAKTEYEGAMNKLVDGRGNLITSAQKLKTMGAKAKKSLPEAIINRANQDSESKEE